MMTNAVLNDKRKNKKQARGVYTEQETKQKTNVAEQKTNQMLQAAMASLNLDEILPPGIGKQDTSLKAAKTTIGKNSSDSKAGKSSRYQLVKPDQNTVLGEDEMSLDYMIREAEDLITPEGKGDWITNVVERTPEMD